MREQRGSLPTLAIEKVKREGALALLRQSPFWALETALTKGQLVALRWWRRVYYRHVGMRAVPDPVATIEVDPADITHVVPLDSHPESDPRALLGTVRGGDWDRDLERVEEQQKYEACRQRVEDDVPWEATGIIDHLAAELEASDADDIEHGCRSREDLTERYETACERLYQSLREAGYDRSKSPVCCRIHVGRDGRLLFGSGGRHRLYLSRLLDVEPVPVQVLCRHRQWQTVREQVAAADTPEALPEHLRCGLSHPDLREFDLGTASARVEASRAESPLGRNRT